MPCPTPCPLAWRFRSPSGGSLCVTKPREVEQSMEEAPPGDPSSCAGEARTGFPSMGEDNSELTPRHRQCSQTACDT